MQYKQGRCMRNGRLQNEEYVADLIALEKLPEHSGEASCKGVVRHVAAAAASIERKCILCV